MPITSPRVFMSGPPELPGLIAASVWMKSVIAYVSRFRPASSLPRPLALMMPAVTVKFSPSGLPMATTHSPMRSFWSSPSPTVGRPLPSILSTATSVCGSRPTIFALNSRRSLISTFTRSAPSTTWLLVRM